MIRQEEMDAYDWSKREGKPKKRDGWSILKERKEET
jgi:hypothetical protein